MGSISVLLLCGRYDISTTVESRLTAKDGHETQHASIAVEST